MEEKLNQFEGRDEIRITLYRIMGRSLNSRGRDADSNRILKTALSLANDTLEKNHLEAAEIQYLIALNYRQLQDVTAGLQFINNVLEVERSNDRPAALVRALGLKGNLLTELGKYAEAEEVLLESVELCEEHNLNLKRFNAMISLADLYRYSKPRKSLELLKSINDRDLSKSQKIAKCTHIAECYLALSLFAEARPYVEDSLRLREKHYGQEHSTYVDAICQLAFIEQGEGNYQKAIELQNRALEIQQKHSPANVTLEMSIKTGLARTYHGAKDYEKAIKIFDSLYLLSKERHGEDCVKTSAFLANLADTFSLAGKHEKAIELLQPAFDNQSVEVDSHEHSSAAGPATKAHVFVQCGRLLAQIQMRGKRYADAAATCSRILPVSTKVYPTDSSEQFTVEQVCFNAFTLKGCSIKSKIPEETERIFSELEPQILLHIEKMEKKQGL